MSGHIVLMQPVSDSAAANLRSRVPDGFSLEIATSLEPDYLKRLIAGADYAVAFDAGVAADVLLAGTKLKLLHKWGAGVENIAMETAHEMGIAVARTTGSNATPVAEFTIGAMIAVTRRLAQVHGAMQQGRWIKNEIWPHSVMLAGKTVGIVGLGTIGRRVAARLRAFECRLLYHNRAPIDAAEAERLGVAYAPLEMLLREADIVSLHCPLTDDTAGMIGRTQLGMMKRSGFLVNLARAGIVSEADLIWALQSGEIAGAAVDVFDAEPTPADNPLLHMDNVVVTPHCAAAAIDNIGTGISQFFVNIARFARGEAIPQADLVSPAGLAL